MSWSEWSEWSIPPFVSIVWRLLRVGIHRCHPIWPCPLSLGAFSPPKIRKRCLLTFEHRCLQSPTFRGNSLSGFPPPKIRFQRNSFLTLKNRCLNSGEGSPGSFPPLPEFEFFFANLHNRCLEWEFFPSSMGHPPGVFPSPKIRLWGDPLLTSHRCLLTCGFCPSLSAFPPPPAWGKDVYWLRQ